jgi:drug/metabolite transporter (DMT)-like permease
VPRESLDRESAAGAIASGAPAEVGAPAARARLRIAALTLTALVAFAANSLLCRLALGSAAIDPSSFTAIRLASGAVALAIIAALRREGFAGSWPSALALFLYAAPFSFAYIFLGAGAGALILFGSVQATMIAAGLRGGERPHRLEWLGLAGALTGLAYLAAPGLSAPPPAGSALMAVAGIAWGAYSLRGRAPSAAASPTATTAGNFLRSVPFAIALSLVLLRDAHVSPRGALLALLSGAITSGVGYAVWYAALAGLSATRAATVQLAVPMLAAFGGIAFLGESMTTRIALAAALILGGVALAIRGRRTEAVPVQRAAGARSDQKKSAEKRP